MEVVSTVKSGKTYETELGGEKVEFTLDDLLISSESAEGYISESTAGLTVVLDAHITEELLYEGMEREIVSRVQNMRKEAGFEVTDRIVLGYAADGEFLKVLKERASSIGDEVLAETVKDGVDADGYVKDFEIGGEKLVLSVKRI